MMTDDDFYENRLMTHHDEVSCMSLFRFWRLADAVLLDGIEDTDSLYSRES
jgi:hypothetical protein